MVKRENKKIDRIQHKKFQGVYHPCVDKKVLLDLLEFIFKRFKIILNAVWTEPDPTRPGEWHTHFIIESEDKMYLTKDESLEIGGVKPELLRIEDDHHLKYLKNYSLKSDKNVLFLPSNYPYPTVYVEPKFLRKVNENNTTPESMADLSVSIRDGTTDILKDCGSIAKIKSVINLFAKGEPIMITEPPPDDKLRPWHVSYKNHINTKEYCSSEEKKDIAVPLSRYNIVFSPLPSQGFNFIMDYYEHHVPGTAIIKLDTEDSMALQIYSIYMRNGIKPIRNIMLRIDDTTILKSDHDTAMSNFLNKVIIAKTRGGTVRVPTTPSIDITIFTRHYVPEKAFDYHSKRLRYIVLNRFYKFREEDSVLSLLEIEANYLNFENFKKELHSLK